MYINAAFSQHFRVACTHIVISETTHPNFTKFAVFVSYLWTVGRSFSGGIVLRYVLPVLNLFCDDGPYGGVTLQQQQPRCIVVYGLTRLAAAWC